MEYGILSLIPPLLAITLAFCTKQVVLSLLTGTFSGALILNDFNIITGFTTTFSTYVSEAMTDSSHAAILVFTLTIGGMVALVTATGGLPALILLVTGAAAVAVIVRFAGKSTKIDDLRKEYNNEDQNI